MSIEPVDIARRIVGVVLVVLMTLLLLAAPAEARDIHVETVTVTSVNTLPADSSLNKVAVGGVITIQDEPVALSAKLGTVQGPSGKETYYNLNMKECVNRMHSLGFQGEYWINDKGCKMFGPYIMCAADLDSRPLGTILESSLGMCCVVDTGDFADSDPNQLDIATNW